MGKIAAIITQNIDGLHQLAGSKKVYELHGSIYNNHCIRCHKYYNINDIIKFKNKKMVPICSCKGIIKPDVVLYNEALNNITIDGAINAIINCDTLIVAGTSLTVYPAAGLIDYFRGKNLILINKDDVHKNVNTLLTINEPVGETLKKINLN
jgi:NAD-dependent deacetylase